MAKEAGSQFPYFQVPAGFDYTKKLDLSGIYKYQPTGALGIPTATTGAFDLSSALPKSADAVNYYLDLAKGLAPLQRQQMIDAAQIQSALTQQELAATYPWLSQAATESTKRNLAASQAYRAFAEGLPSAVEARAASQQARAATAAGAEAERARAMAAQQDAAKRFAGSYAGQTFSVA